MSSEEEREKHSKRRKKKWFTKVSFDPSEYKGAYSMKLEPKNTYKREKIFPRRLEVEGIDE